MRVFFVCVIGLSFAGFVGAQQKVVTSYPYVADLVKRIGGAHVDVESLARGDWDPHFVVPKPSLIAKARRADLLVINGAQLEIGWLPPVIRQANNPAIQPGAPGFLDLSQAARLIQARDQVSRADGDVHPEGNPHYALDPGQTVNLAEAVAARLAALDPEHAKEFEARLADFALAWEKKCAEWQRAMAPFRGKPVIQYHRLFDYFAAYFGLKIVAELEPLPGIPPTSRHVAQVTKTGKSRGVGLVLQDVYHSQKTGQYVAERIGARMVVLPHDVGATDAATSLESLFDAMVGEITK